MATKPAASKKSKPSAPPAKKPAPKPAPAKPEAKKPAAKPAEKSAPKPPPAKAPAKPEVKKPDAKKLEAKKPEAAKPAAKPAPSAPAKPTAPVKAAAAAKGTPLPAAKDAKTSSTPAAKPGAKSDTKADAKAAPAPKVAKPEAKSTGKGGKELPVSAKPVQRYNTMSSDAMAAGRAAAAKLAALAGLQPVQSTANGDRAHKPIERLTKSPFGKKELAEFRDILLQKRTEIQGDVKSLETEALTGGAGGSLSHLPQHMADQGTDTFDQSLALDLVASQRTLLKEINDALVRIEGGTYGICEELGKAISVERLRHTPWARFCIEAARQHERAAWFR